MRDHAPLGPLQSSDFPLPLDEPFRTSDAAAAGLTRGRLAVLEERGQVRRLLRSVYVPAQVPDSRPLRVAALRLVVPQEAVVTDRAAGWLHGAPLILEPGAHKALTPVTMFHRSRGGRLRNEMCSSGQRMMPDSDVMEVGGLLVTTPLRTTLDLGRLLPRDQGFAGMDMMLSTELVTHDEVLASVERFKGCRGVRQLRALTPWIDGRSESPGESVLRLRWIDCPGMPRPEPQVEVEGPYGPCWLDIGDPRSRFAAEYDGEEWHGPEQTEHDESRRSFIAKTQRWTVKVFRRRHVFGRHQNAEVGLQAGMREALDALGRPVGRLDAEAFTTPRWL